MSGYPDKKYRGYDWTELCETFNIPNYGYDHRFSGEESLILECYIISVIYNDYGYGNVLKFTTREVRRYLKALIPMEILNSEEANFWEGILNTKDDIQMLRYFASVCKFAWT
jgi:hypothetical protein